MGDPVTSQSIAALGQALRDGRVTSMALTEATLANVAAVDDQIDSFITVTADRALADAARADKDFKDQVDHGPMQGIPYGLKDIYDTAGIRTTCHSKPARTCAKCGQCVRRETKRRRRRADRKTGDA